MTDDGKFVSESLEDLLVSLAGGVREAQQELTNTPAFDAFGRQLHTYHFPYVDFEFRVQMETANSTSPGRTILRLRKTKTGEQSSSIQSSVSGRLVAVPPGDGLPRPIVQFRSVKQSSKVWRLELSAANSAGEVLAGHEIELNLNLEASRQLSLQNEVTFKSFPPSTALTQSVITTDDSGTAGTSLKVGTMKANSFIVITAEFGGESHNHTIGV
jgi:hypothetical protein